jgi:hypothetical protein
MGLVAAILSILPGCADSSGQSYEFFHDYKLSRYHQEQIILSYYKYYKEKGRLAQDIGSLVAEGYLPEASRIYNDRAAAFGRDIISYKASKFRLVAKGIHDIKRYKCIQESSLENGTRRWGYNWDANSFAADLFFKEESNHAEAIEIYQKRAGL